MALGAAGILMRASLAQKVLPQWPRPGSVLEHPDNNPMTSKEKAMQAYCVKCKEKREVKDLVAVTMKNGKQATQGTCSVCGTKKFKIGKS